MDKPARAEVVTALARFLGIDTETIANPLDPAVLPLNIDGEWQRLKEVIQAVRAALTLERTWPPTLEQLRRQVVGQQQRIIHFMGHGSASDDGAVLCFEQLDGGLALVSARDFLRRTKGTTFLVTLNACVSATPGETSFANLAAALVRQGTPYALGMRFVVADSDARTLSRVLYSELARGSSVEEAVQQVRLELANSPQPWAVGVPVLYTSLNSPAAGFAPVEGQPRISEQQPSLELFSLPRAEGTFQGRQEELRKIGERLTGDNRPRLLTIHGGGGQGKTALAREAVERFAHAFPGGVVAVSLESLPAREQVVTTLARFLGIDTETITDPADLERQVLTRLGQQRTLLVLDNAETLAQAAQAGEAEAQRLAQLMREQMPASTTLLLTSREYLGWVGEETLPLGGLDHRNGARLFAQSAPLRASDIYLFDPKNPQNPETAAWLSEKVEGHPLSLRLLGSAFNDMRTPLAAFIQAHETHLLHSEDTYRDVEHRHRSLYQNIDFSVRFLNDELRALLGGLWVFHAPFQPEMAVALFDPDGDYQEGEHSPILDQLHRLMRRSLLEVETATTSEGRLLFYRLHPAVRLFAEQHLQPPDGREELLQRFGTAYANLSGTLYRGIDRSASLVVVARVCAGDLDRGLEHVPADVQGWYALRRGWVLQRLGDRPHGLALTEQALAAGEHDQDLKLHALNNMGEVYRSTGQPQRALALYEQALPIHREVGNRTVEATTLTNMAAVYDATGQPQRALALYEEALPLMRAVGDTVCAASPCLLRLRCLVLFALSCRACVVLRCLLCGALSCAVCDACLVLPCVRGLRGLRCVRGVRGVRGRAAGCMPPREPDLGGESTRLTGKGERPLIVLCSGPFRRFRPPFGVPPVCHQCAICPGCCVGPCLRGVPRLRGVRGGRGCPGGRVAGGDVSGCWGRGGNLYCASFSPIPTGETPFRCRTTVAPPLKVGYNRGDDDG